MIALLAGIGGIISQLLFFYPFQIFAGTVFFDFLFSLAIYGLVVITALVALAQIYRPTVTGFLQGMLWLGASSLVTMIVLFVEVSYFHGPTLAGWIIEIASLALGVIAAILLMISWSPAAERRQARQIRGLPLMLLGVAGLSQIPVLIFYVRMGNALSLTSYHYYALGSTGVLVALGITWYAMSLRPRALGGAVVLGWVTAAAMLLTINIIQWWSSYLFDSLNFWVILGYVLLAAVVVLTIIYVRKPSDLEASPN